MKTWAAVLTGALTLAFFLAGCNRESSKLQGVYEAQIGQPPEHISLDFKSDQKVLVRRLSDKNPFVVESDYSLKNGRVSIKQFGFVAMNGYLELSVQGDTLIAANGDGFIKVVPGRTYTPVERANAEVEAQAKLASAKLQEEKNKAAQLELENKKIAAQEAEFRMHAEEVKQRVASDEQKAKEEAARAEATKAQAIEQRRVAKIAAVTSLPHFTNQVAVIHAVDGTVYTNIVLMKASANGIVYGFQGASGSGGFISYTNVMVDDLVRFGIDPNVLPSEEELAELKAKDAEYRKQMLIDGAVATDTARKKYIAMLVERVRHGDRQAPQTLKGMGLNPYTGNPIPKTAVNSPSVRYGAP